MHADPVPRTGSPGLYGRNRDSQHREPRRALRRKSVDAVELGAVMGHGKGGLTDRFINPMHADLESANGKRGNAGGTALWRVSRLSSAAALPLHLLDVIVDVLCGVKAAYS